MKLARNGTLFGGRDATRQSRRTNTLPILNRTVLVVRSQLVEGDDGDRLIVNLLVGPLFHGVLHIFLQKIVEEGNRVQSSPRTECRREASQFKLFLLILYLLSFFLDVRHDVLHVLLRIRLAAQCHFMDSQFRL